MTECFCYCHRTYDDCGTDCCKQAKESERRDREMSAKCYEEDRIREEQNQKLRELIEIQKTNTKAILSDDSPNKEELQHLLNLFDYLLEESKK